MEIDTDCLHMSVDYEPFTCDGCGEPHGAWVCRDCDEEFVPVIDVEDQHERMSNAMAALVLTNVQLRGRALAAATLWVGTVLGAILL